MDLTIFCKQILDRIQTPCFLADFQTYQVKYANTAMKLFLNHQDEPDIYGGSFLDIIKDEDPSHNEISFLQDCMNQQISWKEEQVLSYGMVESSSHRPFQVTVNSFVFHLEQYFLVHYHPLDETIGTCHFDQAMTQCLHILQQDESDILTLFLRLVGEFYGVERSCLYHVNRKNMTMTCTAHWCASAHTPVFDELSAKVNIADLLAWLDSKHNAGIVELCSQCHDYPTNSMESQLMEAFQLDNVTLCLIENNKQEVVGVVALHNRSLHTASDFRLLQTVARFMEQTVSKAEMQCTLQKMNDTDVLTGFGSRTSYSQKVDEIQENPPKEIGVIFINVNGLKKINVEFGYSKGDEYIKNTAERIKNYFLAHFYRISGDEFVGFFPDVEKSDFEQKVNAMYEWMKQEEHDSFALGHAWGSGRYDIVNLIREADTVMYINKQEYYHSSNRRFEEISDSTLSDLLSYLDNDEFMVYLQPQVKLSDGSLYGAEALIRRFDKTNQKMVFPDQFIPLYEKKSVIRHVDIFVVERVCQLLKSWGEDYVHIPISVNLSRVTLLEFGIVKTIAKICDKYQIPHELLVIEVTERVGLIENNVASSLIRDFNEHGFKISLDDFGCAYSNIVTLAQISVDEVKIDKSLVDYLVTNQKNRVLVKNILTMCNELEDTSTLAEGIEDEEQAQLLKDYHCHLGQGYLYSRPIPTDEFFQKYISKTSKNS